MRFSPYSTTKSERLIEPLQSNADFFRAVERSVDVASLHGAILLVGARDPRSLAMRRAQAALRFDRLDSYWSHAALIVQWAKSKPADTRGLEVALDPSDVAEQVPERNGVTSFRLSRYGDARRYPNLALVSLTFAEPEQMRSRESVDMATELDSPGTRRRALLHAASNPNRDRERFALWDSLGPWARYAYSPHSTANPLLDGVPMPSAALCEYAYESAGVDLTPGATGNHCCPETLYATVMHWVDGLKELAGASVRIFSVVRDPAAAPQQSLSPSIEGIVPPFERQRKAAQRRAAPRKRST